MAACPALPAPPESFGQQVGEHTLVQLGEGDDVLEQATRIEGPPDAVRDGAGPVGHHHMVVKLGVAGPRVPVGEGGGHHTFDVFLDHATLARARAEHLAFGVGQHDVDGPAVAVVDERLGLPVGQRPGRGHRLGWREREVEPGHGAAELCALSSFLGLDPGPLFGSLGLTGGWRDGLHSLRHPGGQGEVRAVGRAAQGLASHRIGAHPEQVEQVLFADRRTLLDPSAVVEGAQPGAEEHSRWGTRLGVVVGQTRRLATDSIARGHGLHQVPIPSPQTHPA